MNDANNSVCKWMTMGTGTSSYFEELPASTFRHT
jgi:hypothetical protein